MLDFNIINRNEDGTLNIEYPVYNILRYTIPTDENGVELRGQALADAIAIQLIEHVDTEVASLEIDPNIQSELGLI